MRAPGQAIAARRRRDGVRRLHQRCGILQRQPVDRRARLLRPPLLQQPARTVGDKQQKHDEQAGRRCRNAQLHSPKFGCIAAHPDQRIAEIRCQYADDDAELEGGDHAASLRRWADLRDIDRRGHRGSADRQTAEQAKGDEQDQIAAQGAADRRQDIGDANPDQYDAAAMAIAGLSRAKRADQRPHQGSRYCCAQPRRRQIEAVGKRLSHPRYDSRVEAEQQTAQRCGGRRAPAAAPLCYLLHCPSPTRAFSLNNAN